MATNETNQAEISGKVSLPPNLSHSIYGESFYTFMIQVPRLSGNADTLPVIVSERIISRVPIGEGDRILIRGQLRSYNKIVDGASRLELKIFAREIQPWAEEEYLNRIDLTGFLCKPPVYRTTPFGREITDMLIAVNRSYNKSDYIPSIVWGRNAKTAQTYRVGQKIRIEGRIQSREYEKLLDNGEKIIRVAYEVSAASAAPEPPEKEG